MDAGVFSYLDYYFEQSLKLIVYSYTQIKKEKSANPYSRREIHESAKKIHKSEKSKNELENYLRNDLVTNYLKKKRHLFKMTQFSIQPGSETSKSNINVGVVDIRFEVVSADTMDGTAFVFECKRLNKYQNSQNAYIKDGMMRFVSGRYYAESKMNVAGMLAFVETDLENNPGGCMPVAQVSAELKKRIDSYPDLWTTEKFSSFRLSHQKYREISSFKSSFLSKHVRNEDNREISIYHLLLDYYDILKV